MDEQPHFLHLWDRLGSKEAIKDFLLNTFHLFNELVNKDIYPSEWSSMRFMAIHILLKTLQVSILSTSAQSVHFVKSFLRKNVNKFKFQKAVKRKQIQISRQFWD